MKTVYALIVHGKNLEDLDENISKILKVYSSREECEKAYDEIKRLLSNKTEEFWKFNKEMYFSGIPGIYNVTMQLTEFVE